MKAKHVFTTLGLALTMGLGVFAGLAHGRGFLEAKAAVSEEDWGDDVYLVGGMNGWTFNTGHLTYNETKLRYEYSFTVTSANIDFKITNQAGWSGREINSGWLNDVSNGFSQTNFLDYVKAGSSNNMALKQDGQYVFYWTKGSNTTDVCAEFGFERSEIEDYTPHSYTLVGSKLANSWDPTDTNYDFQMSNGNKTATYTGDFVSGSEFKIVEDHSWDVNYGYSDIETKPDEISEKGGNCFVKSSGNYTITLTTNENYQKQSISIVKNSLLPYKAYSLVGTWDGEHLWDTYSTDYEFTPAVGGKSATLNATLAEDVQFKIVSDHAWGDDIGYNAAYVPGIEIAMGEEGGNFKVLMAGTFSFTITLNDDYSFKSLLIETTLNFTLKVGDDSVTLNKKAGETGVYYAENVPIEAGQTIRYLLNDEIVAGQKGERVANNNLSELGKVYVDNADATIYVHTSDKTLWVSGLPTGGYHLVKNDRTLVQMADAGTYDIYTQRKTELLEFAANDKFQFVDCGAEESYPVFFNNAEIEPEGLGANFEVDGDYIKCKTACTAAVYLKLNIGGNKIYFGEVSQDLKDATKFAHDFLEAMKGVCREENQDETYVEGLKTAWQAQITEFGKLVKEAKDILKAAKDDDSVEDIRNFIKAYNYIAGKYKAKLGAGWDFLEKGISSNAIREVKVINNTALIIILVSTITVISAAGLFLVIRRRKHN